MPTPQHFANRSPSQRLALVVGPCLVFVAVTLAVPAGLSAHRAGVPAAGTTYVVNNTADVPDPDAANPVCAAPNGQCTLRAAVQDANFAGGVHTITLPAGLYVLTRPGYDDNALVGDLDIAHDLTIQGAGSGVTIVDGNGAVTGDRVFQVLSSANVVSLSGMTVRNGRSLSSTVGVIGGGGLYMEGAGTLSLSDVIFEGNTAENGGGIYANFSIVGGSLAMDHVILRANSAPGSNAAFSGKGGGAFVYRPPFSAFSVRDSQVYSNAAYYSGGGFQVDGDGTAQSSIERSQFYSNTAPSGGAIANSVPLNLSDSRLHDNYAAFDGGAIFARENLAIARTTLDANGAGNGGAISGLKNGGGGTSSEFVQIVQSTLSGNYAKYGGAIYIDGSITPGSRLTLLNSTLSSNLANNGGGGLYVYGGQVQLLNATVASNWTRFGLGGGLYITASATFTGLNSLLAYNRHGLLIMPVADDCFSSGTVGTLAYNLIMTTTNCIVSGPQPGNIVGQDPLLGPLQNNGGSTQTRALLPGSLAIDADNPGGCTDGHGAPLSTDQRGFARPVNGGIGLRCDRGAYEYYRYGIFLPLVNR